MSVTPASPVSLAPVHDRPGPPSGRAGAPPHAKASTPAAAGDRVEISEAAGENREPGVVRLLREGHFNGVADVRLRMNFAEHFSNEQAVEQQVDVDSTAQSMLATLHGKLDELSEEVATAEPVQQAVSDFEQQLTDLSAGSDGEPGAGVEALQASRQAVIEALGEALLTEAETGQTETAGDDVADADADPMATWLSALDAALGELIENLQAAPTHPMDALPPLSEPSGQGTAYNKFLAQYQQMMGLDDEKDPAVDDDPPASSVEASVDTLA